MTVLLLVWLFVCSGAAPSTASTVPTTPPSAPSPSPGLASIFVTASTWIWLPVCAVGCYLILMFWYIAPSVLTMVAAGRVRNVK